MAEGEQVHISTYPPCWPTRPPTQRGAYDLRRAIEIRAGAHAFEAKVFNIVSSAFADQTLNEKVAREDKAMLDIIEGSPRSVSMILDPAGEAIGEALSENEGIVYAEIDTSRSVEPKQFHDLTGSIFLTYGWIVPPTIRLAFSNGPRNGFRLRPMPKEPTSTPRSRRFASRHRHEKCSH
jgi:predicted amidohydrolase